jgi:hypothetical protein
MSIVPPSSNNLQPMSLDSRYDKEYRQKVLNGVIQQVNNRDNVQIINPQQQDLNIQSGAVAPPLHAVNQNVGRQGRVAKPKGGGGGGGFRNVDAPVRTGDPTESLTSRVAKHTFDASIPSATTGMDKIQKGKDLQKPQKSESDIKQDQYLAGIAHAQQVQEERTYRQVFAQPSGPSTATQTFQTFPGADMSGKGKKTKYLLDKKLRETGTSMHVVLPDGTIRHGISIQMSQRYAPGIAGMVR